MKNKPGRSILQKLLPIYQAAATSNDGERCMIAPSPEVREELKKELKRLRGISSNEVLSNLLTAKQQTRLGFNDGIIYPGKVFPLGTPPSALRAHVKRKPLQGTLRVIVILAEFPDKKLKHTKKYYNDLFFSTGVVPTGSVNEYYQEVTGGLIDIQGEIAGPFVLPKKLSAYAGNASGVGENEPNARTMALDTAKAANNSVDFLQYDNDQNGYVDAFVVIHAGRGAEETAAKTDIWSHKWLLPEEFDADGTKIYAYLTVPEDCKLGVCAHELGHLLFGFPDLYDTDYSSEGVGQWCLMAAGSWNNKGLTPAHPCAWCKSEQNWVTVVNQSSNQSTVPIEDVISSKKIYRLWKDGGPGNEYFLLENRQKKNYDEHIPAGGLLIWHIDESMTDNSNERHYKVALVQADALKDLEKGNNTGDAGDCWPGTAKNQNFNAKSNPNSKSYGGIDTMVQVNSINAQNNGIVTADLFVKKGSARPPKKKRKSV